MLEIEREVDRIFILHVKRKWSVDDRSLLCGNPNVSVFVMYPDIIPYVLCQIGKRLIDLLFWNVEIFGSLFRIPWVILKIVLTNVFEYFHVGFCEVLKSHILHAPIQKLQEAPVGQLFLQNINSAGNIRKYFGSRADNLA